MIKDPTNMILSAVEMVKDPKAMRLDDALYRQFLNDVWLVNYEAYKELPEVQAHIA